MSAALEILAVVRQWLDKAEGDLRAAVQILKMREDCPYETVGFHAQQCAEKHLKALLVLLEIHFPKTHDLTSLLAKMPPTLNMQALSRSALELTPYAAEARYPGDWETLNRSDALRAVRHARDIRKAVRAKLPRSVIQKDSTSRRRRS